MLYEENTQSQKLKSITLINFNMVLELDEPSMASVSPSPIHQSLPSSQSISVAFPSTLPLASIRLNRSNYNLWRSQILPTVCAYDLENYLLGTVTPPVKFVNDQSTVNPAYSQWLRLDQFLLSWLLSSISESMLGHVVNCNSSSEIWTTLGQLFSTKSKDRLLHLRFLLQTTKKGSLSIEDYFMKMKTIAQDLMSAGQSVSDDEFVLYILGGLGLEFDSVVVNLTSKDSVTLPKAQFLLQTQELRLETLNTNPIVDVSHATANTATTAYRRGNFNSSSQPPVTRGYPAHRGRGRGRSSSGYRGSYGPPKLSCQICGKQGHSALKCYHRFDISFSGNSSRSSGSQPLSFEPPTHSQTYLTTSQFFKTEYNGSDDAWYLDSGVTHHTTSNSAALDVKTEYNGSGKLLVGNGSALPISHIGHSSLSYSRPLHLRNILLVPAIKKNLINISQFTLHNNVLIEFDASHCYVKDKVTKATLVQGQLHDGLYQLDLPSPTSQLHSSLSSVNTVSALHNDSTTASVSHNPPSSNCTTCNKELKMLSLWHNRLGHPHP